RQYLRLSEAIFLESNPIPVKAALAMMGLLDPIWRLPLVPMNPANEAKLRQVMQTCGVIGS
ncbi:MAG TPA: dihydrodipicolinate synthase family protein, partial [Bryobacteraceae bacterium]|nr:dihydrodipicolinate synthase family protein [Bryobacteraceae bacterium]